jgi:hypothetical protein
MIFFCQNKKFHKNRKKMLMIIYKQMIWMETKLKTMKFRISKTAINSLIENIKVFEYFFKGTKFLYMEK